MIALTSLWSLLPAAWAGSVHLQSQSPVSYRVDGEYVARMVVAATVEDVRFGHHTVEALDALGAVLASQDVTVGNFPVFLRYEDHRLDILDPNRMSLDELGLGDLAIKAQEFLELERDLAKRTDKKRYKVLAAVVDDHWFEMRHVDSILGAFDTLTGRVAAAVLLAPKTVDPHKFAAIEDHFPPGEYLDRARRAYLETREE
jgi:hypothetical protein